MIYLYYYLNRLIVKYYYLWYNIRDINIPKLFFVLHFLYLFFLLGNIYTQLFLIMNLKTGQNSFDCFYLLIYI